MSLSREFLRSSIESLFVPRASGAGAMRIGAEIELIPFDEQTRRVVPAFSTRDRGSVEVIRSISRRAGWSETPNGDDPPSWCLPDGARLSFEPGGQIELSSAPSDDPSKLIRDLQCTAQLLTSAFASAGFLLESVGVDPYNDVSDVDLQLHRPRYETMTRYFDSIGDSGIRMMRQTASIQLCVDPGDNPLERWSLLNQLAPYVTAIFANSRFYNDRLTDYQSYRSHFWRTLDTSRTGSFSPQSAAVDSYLDFALAAGAIMRLDETRSSFGDWVRDGSPTIDDWDFHLSTLFPEVRPRGYFELRSADAIDPDLLAAPICFVAGLAYDDASSNSALELLGAVAPPPLDIAGREGLRNRDIQSVAVELTDIALSGCESLGESYISRSDIEAASDFFERYTRRGRSPGDDRS
jgi:glutamate--cysteine ligase